MRAVVRAVVALGLVVGLGAAEARASSIWDRVVDPTVADRDYAHAFAAEKELEAEQLDELADASNVPSSLAGESDRPRVNAVLAREAARAVLERFGAETSPDVRLRFDLGHVLARLHSSMSPRCPKAVEVLLGALKMAPNHPRASSAWFDVAICDAHLGRRDEETKAYEAALAVADDPDERTLLLSNLAEARMSLGKLEEARAAAEASLALQPELTLTRWTLGVILDRAGDTFGALEQIKIAVVGDPLFARLHSRGVFFEPENEVHYYQGLGELALARASAPKSKEWEFHLFSALSEFLAYEAKAEPNDRWIARADDHIAFVELTLNLRTPKEYAAGKKGK